MDAQGQPQPIYPTPVIGMVGLIPDLGSICGQAWQAEGDRIYLLGIPLGRDGSCDRDTLPLVTLGGSEYLAVIHQTISGQPPETDFDLELRVQATCRQGIRNGWVGSAHDSAEGGVAIALAECCISGQRGARIHLTALPAPIRWDELLFGEGGGTDYCVRGS